MLTNPKGWKKREAAAAKRRARTAAVDEVREIRRRHRDGMQAATTAEEPAADDFDREAAFESLRAAGQRLPSTTKDETLRARLAELENDE